ncbi:MULTISPECIES: GNAT family N-acetyltransferase [Enterobacterales]|uniref:GNAT family N-acetyltransferase n=1 Tax=Enterobacterales TaxID=91347 RepID=UPI0021D78D26|nr:GNAT family N-acetyltransferase [Pectobacterium sp. F1-1]UYA62439.1 hypothetical protein NAL19_4430 [Pectobacterium sp. F1-1]
MNVEIESVKNPSSDGRVIFLIENLNVTLNKITGSDGSKNADLTDFLQEKALFLLALRGGEAIACGGFRPLNSEICEIKRMYSLEKNTGLGSKILQELEFSAQKYGYNFVCLETRLVNTDAVNFYLKKGYKIIDNYGVYIGRPEAVCFGKSLPTHHE